MAMKNNINKYLKNISGVFKKNIKPISIFLVIITILIAGILIRNRNSIFKSKNSTTNQTSTQAQDRQKSNEEKKDEAGPSQDQKTDSNVNAGTSSTTPKPAYVAPSTPPQAPSSKPGAVATPDKKITNWNVYIYQQNIPPSVCGTSSNPCAYPGGLIVSIVAVDEDTGYAIPLKDCSMTAAPSGFTLPGGSFSLNPALQNSAGIPICTGELDAPVGGQYRLNYELWLADSLGMDLPYRGGVIQYFNVKNQYGADCCGAPY